jgi:uncharacterized protein YegJ (DUF2314 family)
VLTLLKRAFGLVTLLTGATLLIFGLGQMALVPDEPFQVWPLIGGLAWGAVSWHFGRKWLFNWMDLRVIGVEPDHPTMLAAARQARSTLDALWYLLAQNRYECYVKFPLETKPGVREHIWALVHAREGDEVAVSLANEPVDEPATSGDRRLVPIRDLEDWQVVVSPTEVRGGYSTQALAAVAVERGYSLSPKDRGRLGAYVDVWKPAAEVDARSPSPDA